MWCWTSKPVSELLIDPTRGVCSRCPQAAQNTACARLAVPHLSQKSVGVIISLHKILHIMYCLEPGHPIGLKLTEQYGVVAARFIARSGREAINQLSPSPKPQ